MPSRLLITYALEYRLDASGTRYIRLFHDKNYDSVLEGEITETGLGLVLRKKMDRLSELFIFKRKKKWEKLELLLLAGILCASCSTTKNLPEGEVLFTGNKINYASRSATRVGQDAVTEVNAALDKDTEHEAL